MKYINLLTNNGSIFKSLSLGACIYLLIYGLALFIPGSLQSQPSWNQPFIKVKDNAPNILFICTDQQRWNTIGALGNEFVKTPNLDRLVREGVSFTNAYAQSPICTPSRASFMTGMYPSTIRASKNGAAAWADAAPLISKTLGDGGYDCGLAGKLHLSTAMAHRPEIRPDDDGFRIFWNSHSPYQSGSANDYIKWHSDRGTDIMRYKEELGYVPAEYHQTTWITDRAIDFMEEKREWPWFFILNIYDPHGPFDPPEEYLKRYKTMDLPDPWVNEGDIVQKSKLNDVLFQSKPRHLSSEENREMMARYWAQIDLIDENIGRLLKALEETNQLDNTMIIFTTDHGDMLGDHGLTAKGCRFYEGLVRVPLIFWYPKMFVKNLQSPALVELTDIVPTILDVTGLEKPKEMQGLSLLSILTGKKSPDHHRDYVRSEFYNTLLPGKGESPAFATMIRDERYKLVNYHGRETGELFDLKNDPEEFHNLWDDPKHRDLRFDLMKKSFDLSIKSMDTGPERLGRY